MSWKILGSDRKVAVILDPNFQGDLVALAAAHPIWIVATPQNLPRIERAWNSASELDLCIINKFDADDPNDREDSLVGVLDAIEDHHGRNAAGGGYNGLVVYGITPDALFREKLTKLGFEIVESRDAWFIAVGTLKHAVYMKHYSEI
jgi:hypothetical protein